MIKLVRLHAEDRFFLRNQAFFHHLQRDFHGSNTRAFTIAGLQHVQLALLDGELEILHVAIVLFQSISNLAKLAIHIGHDFLQLGDMHRGTDAGHNVLTLRVHEELAVELLDPSCRIAREAHARAAALAQIAEHHRLYVNRGPQVVGDVVDAPIVLGAIVIPRPEDGVASHHELLVWVLRKVALSVLLHDLLVFRDHFIERLGIKVSVELRFFLLLLSLEDALEFLFFDLEHHVAEHLDQAPVGVIRKTRIFAPLGQRLHALVV